MNFSKKILYADTDVNSLAAMTETFEKEGYEVFFIENGSLVIEKALQIRPDIIILEVVLPNVDGIEICSELRKIPSFNETLIIFLSSRHEDFVHIAALDAGGDGYFLKPIRSRLMLSQIKAIERRGNKNTVKKVRVPRIFNPVLDIDEDKVCALVNGTEIPLPKREFEILQLLLSKPGKVFSRSEIFRTIWHNESSTSERAIDVHITKLRKKIGETTIVTHKGLGYKVII